MTVGFEPTHVLRNALAGHPLKTTRASHLLRGCQINGTQYT
jgi:hypothetical protein